MEIAFLKPHIVHIINDSETLDESLKAICAFLKNEISYYDWVGFYFRNGEKEELKLRQFSGDATEHTVIPFGKGICGQVALSNQNFVVQDVSSQDNYISCGFKIKSEIVIPIFKNGENIGQIDIDSHTLNPFSKDDEVLLEFVCEQVSKIV